MMAGASDWDSVFDRHRLIGDASADAVIADVVAKQQVQALNHLMRTIITNDDLPLAGLPDGVVDYLENTLVLPLWTDVNKLRRAVHLFHVYGPEIVMLLFGASLPILYAKQAGAPVLTVSMRLSDTATFQRRIVETAQFLIDVTDEGAFTDSGRGIRTVQKVRLMHAAIRHYIGHDKRWQNVWDSGWGIPINQSDLAGTMFSFSVTVIAGLEKAGIRVSEADKEAYLHLWKLVGHIMGIVPDLLPSDYPTAVEMMDIWMNRGHGASDSGILLTQTLINFMYERVPGRWFDRYATNWMRFWLGDVIADALEIPPYHQGLLALMRLQQLLWQVANRIHAASPLVYVVTRFFSRRLLLALIDIERAGKDIEFRIPEPLQAQWGLRR